VNTPTDWQQNLPYRYGHHLYAHAFFWEAHEVWEPVWMGCTPNSQERALVQGLIQFSNACLKICMGRHQAAFRLVSISLEHICEIRTRSAPLMGLDPTTIHDHILEFEKRLFEIPGGAPMAEILPHRPVFLPE